MGRPAVCRPLSSFPGGSRSMAPAAPPAGAIPSLPGRPTNGPSYRPILQPEANVRNREKAAPRAARTACPRTEKARRRWRLARSGRPEAQAAGRGGCSVTFGRGSGRVGPGRRAKRAGPRQGRRGPIATGRSGWNTPAAGGIGVGGEGRGYDPVPARSARPIVPAAESPRGRRLPSRIRQVTHPPAQERRRRGANPLTLFPI